MNNYVNLRIHEVGGHEHATISNIGIEITFGQMLGMVEITLKVDYGDLHELTGCHE